MVMSSLPLKPQPGHNMVHCLLSNVSWAKTSSQLMHAKKPRFGKGSDAYGCNCLHQACTCGTAALCIRPLSVEIESNINSNWSLCAMLCLWVCCIIIRYNRHMAPPLIFNTHWELVTEWKHLQAAHRAGGPGIWGPKGIASLHLHLKGRAGTGWPACTGPGLPDRV